MIYYIGFLDNAEKGNEFLSYEGIYLSDENDNKKQFKTGNFIIDWYECTKHLNNLSTNGYLPRCSVSSQINHLNEYDFDYDSKYLKDIDNTFVLTDDTSGIEFFVPNGITTWEELKEYVKTNKL